MGAAPWKGRIIGGEQIRIADASYQLSVRFGGDHICGGSLISATRALTAAQCRIPTSPLHKYTITAGSRFLYGDASSKSPMVYAWINHPSYVPNSKNFDIAVLWLTLSFTLSQSISYIRLPDQNEPVPVGEKATVAGWGANVEPENSEEINFNFVDHLRSTQVKILLTSECNPMLRATKNGGRVTDQMICADSIDYEETGVCSGDEGGALVVDGIQHGIISTTGRCTRPHFLATYTRVSSYADWINSVLTE